MATSKLHQIASVVGPNFTWRERLEAFQQPQVSSLGPQEQITYRKLTARPADQLWVAQSDLENRYHCWRGTWDWSFQTCVSDLQERWMDDDEKPSKTQNHEFLDKTQKLVDLATLELKADHRNVLNHHWCYIFEILLLRFTWCTRKPNHWSRSIKNVF